jgi:hypothetical protein
MASENACYQTGSLFLRFFANVEREQVEELKLYSNMVWHLQKVFGYVKTTHPI